MIRSFVSDAIFFTAVFALQGVAFQIAAPADDLAITPFRALECSDKSTFAIAVDGTQRLVVTGGGDNAVSLWDLATSKRIRSWQPSASTVIDLAFHPDAPLVVSASYPKAVTLYDARADEQVWQTQCFTAPTRVAFSRDASKIAVGSTYGKASIYDAGSGTLLAAADTESSNSNAIDFAADSRTFFVAANPDHQSDAPAEIVQCDVSSGKVLRTLGSHQAPITRLLVSPRGDSLVSIDRAGGCIWWNLGNARPLQTWKLSVQRTNNLQFLDDRTAVVGGQGAMVVVRLGEQAPTVVKTGDAVDHVVTLPQRGLIGSAADKKLTLYRFDKRQISEPEPPIQPAAPAGADGADSERLPEQANQPPGEIRFDALMQRDALEQLLGKPLAIKLRSGRFIVKVVLDELQFDRKQNGLKFIKYLSETGRSSTVKAEEVYAFWVGEQRLALRYFPPNSQLYVINSSAADAIAESRLTAMGAEIRSYPTEEEQAEATAEHKRFLQDAAKKLSDIGNFRIEETESTLLFTDYPPAATVGLGRFVDQLNSQLNHMFGIPQKDSIWRGKAILAVFSTPAVFGAFEEKVMNNPNHAGRAGVRSGEKRFLQTAIAKTLDDNVARGISWGYSLGFAARLHSSARGVPWITMGIANTVQFAIVPDQSRQQSQRSSVIASVRRTGTLLGLLDATRLEQERWPMGGQLVQYLMQTDPVAFSQMYRDVKLGVPLDEALQQNFAFTKEQLAEGFGRSLGMPGVKP